MTLNMSRRSYTSVPMRSDCNEMHRKLNVSVCTSAQPYSVQEFINEIQTRFIDVNVQYYELPYNDIDRFSFRGKNIDVMVLCHSIHNRRFAITDVTDALYNTFLPHAARSFGKGKVCVIVHDMPLSKLNTPERYMEEMDVFKRRQPTTFENADQVMIVGKLDTKPVELQEGNWDELQVFLRNASRLPKVKPVPYVNIKVLVAALAAFLVLLVIVGFGVGLNRSEQPTTRISPSHTRTGAVPSVSTIKQSNKDNAEVHFPGPTPNSSASTPTVPSRRERG